MGTVGLSFGSPTSGAGFDVSSTVSAIVSNLQNVETPWKTQLTKLESQDTAISSLGTLFSNLSNDLSSLTDFEGVMALKTGSVSDTNVMTITAADNTAIAGTHTVEVTNLAQTSSGYLAPITDSSTALSGSITLQVGNGAAKTISVPTTSGENTLAGLAAAINSSGVGINASVLTDSSGSRLSLVSGTSGVGGNITISANSITAAAPNTLSYASSTSSSGTLSPVGSLSDVLTGSIAIGVDGGPAQIISLGSSGETLQQLADAINDPTSGVPGVTASIVTNSDGSSSLSLSSSAGALNVASSVADPSSQLGYTTTVSGRNANLTVDGVNLTSASNTVANLIPGLTFQLLAPSSTGEQVQVVIGNDNTGVESTVNQMVSDYNSLISAINAQESNDSSGNPEPLFGSPTLSLLQQQLLSGLNMQSPNGYLDSIADSSDTLSGSLTIGVRGGTAKTIVIGSAPDAADGGPAVNTIYTGSGSNSNTLAGVVAAINASNTNLSYSDTGYTSENMDSGSVGPISNSGDTLAGSISIAVGSGTAQTIELDSSDNTLAGLADAINGTTGIGVTASVVTNSDGTSSLSLVSQTAGTDGALTVSSNLTDGIGVTAKMVTSSTGSQLTLVSNTSGAGGALTVNSSITDVTTSTALNYNSGGSDINSLTSLGISVNNDGSLTFDANSLDSVLNTDYSSVVGFFQNADSWGQTFSTMLTNSGTGSSTGILALASTSNSNIESTLNADVSKEQSLISVQQASLTAELNSANEILQQLPSQLQGVNEMYAAITGYNQNTNG